MHLVQQLWKSKKQRISLKKIFHSERGDIDITLDFKGGPRIYFVPEVYEDLSDYIMDLLREIMAINPKVNYRSRPRLTSKQSNPCNCIKTDSLIIL